MVIGGGVESTIFICENNRKSNKIMHCLDFFLSGSFEDMGIFFNLNSKTLYILNFQEIFFAW